MSGTPAAAAGGSYPLKITASNGVLPNASQDFTLMVITSASAGGEIASCKLSMTSFTGSQAGKVKLSCKFSPESKIFRYVLTIKKGKKWTVVKSAKRTGSFTKYTLTVKQLFVGKPVERGTYRLELSADKNSKTLSFKVT